MAVVLRDQSPAPNDTEAPVDAGVSFRLYEDLYGNGIPLTSLVCVINGQPAVSPLTGVGISISSLGILVGATPSFTVSDIGRSLTITGATDPTNNQTQTIIGILTPFSVQLSGTWVLEASLFTWTSLFTPNYKGNVTQDGSGGWTVSVKNRFSNLPYASNIPISITGTETPGSGPFAFGYSFITDQAPVAISDQEKQDLDAIIADYEAMTSDGAEHTYASSNDAILLPPPAIAAGQYANGNFVLPFNFFDTAEDVDSTTITISSSAVSPTNDRTNVKITAVLSPTEAVVLADPPFIAESFTFNYTIRRKPVQKNVSIAATGANLSLPPKRALTNTTNAIFLAMLRRCCGGASPTFSWEVRLTYEPPEPKNGGNTLFTTPVDFAHSSDSGISIYLNGVRQRYLIDYTVGPGPTIYNQVNFVVAPLVGDYLIFDYSPYGSTAIVTIRWTYEPTEVIDGANSTYTTPTDFTHTASTGLGVYLNGIRQRYSIDYTVGPFGGPYNIINFIIPPQIGDYIIFDYLSDI